MDIHPAWLRRVAQNALLALLYLGTARLGLGFGFDESNASPVWPAAGVALVGLLWWGWRVWPGIWLGGLAVHFLDLVDHRAASLFSALGVSFFLACGNTLEALAGWWLCRHWPWPRRAAVSPSPFFAGLNVFEFTALSMVIALVGAVIGPLTLCVAGFESWATLGVLGLVWWIGNATGIFLVTPFLLVWSVQDRPRWEPIRILEALAAFTALSLAAWVVFGFGDHVRTLPYLTLPALVWMAVRIGPGPVTFGLIALAAYAIGQTYFGYGPFAPYGYPLAMIHLLFFVWVVAVTTLALAGTLDARKKSEASLAKLSAELDLRVKDRTAELERSNLALQAESQKLAQSAQATRRVEERYRLVAENFPHGALFVFDHDLRYVSADGTSLARVGLSKAALEGKTIWEALPPEIARQVEPHYRAALAGRESVFESQFGGREYLVRAVPLRDERRQILGGLVISHDVTPQKRAEAELKRERDFTAAVLEMTSALVITSDRWGRVVRFNRACQQVSGYTFAEIQGKHGLDLPFLLPEELPGLRGAWDELMAGKSPVRWENHWVTKDGDQRLTAWSNASLTGPQNQIEYIVSTGVDITEQRRIEAALRQSEELFRSAVDSFPGAFTLYDTEKRLRYANRHALEVTGLREEDFLGRTSEEVFGPEVTARYVPALDRCLREKKPQTFETTIPFPAGSYTAVINLAPIFDARGEIYQILGTSYDITSLRAAEKAREEFERRFRAMLESANDAIITADYQGRIVGWNKGAQQIFGYSPEEALQKPVSDLLPERYRSAFEVRLKRLQAKGLGRIGAKTWEIAARRQNGREFPAELSISTWRWNEQACFGAIIRDITERKQAEEQLRAALRKEEILRREIHHRVKNNLQVISSLLFLQSTHTDDQHVQEVLREGQSRARSIGLTYQLLSERKDMTRIAFPDYVRQLAMGLLTAYRVRADAVTLQIGGANIFLDLDTAVPCGLIITELLSNALKYAFPPDAKGRIVIDLLGPSDGFLTLIVQDDGVGFPENFDGERSSTMGLKLVRDLARQLNGTIVFKTHPGTTVEIRFPAPSSSSS